MSSDGTNVRRLTDALDVRGAASWSPDGKWIAVAANAGTGTYVYKVPVNGGSPVRLTDTASYNPLWSPDGSHLLFLSDRTVHRHVSNIFDKLGVHSRTAAAAYGIQHHIIDAGIL